MIIFHPSWDVQPLFSNSVSHIGAKNAKFEMVFPSLEDFNHKYQRLQQVEKVMNKNSRWENSWDIGNDFVMI